MAKCAQCREPADMHIAWLAKKTLTEDIPQECDICSSCLSIIWNGGGTIGEGKKHPGFKNTQFGTTLQIIPI